MVNAALLSAKDQAFPVRLRLHDLPGDTKSRRCLQNRDSLAHLHDGELATGPDLCILRHPHPDRDDNEREA